MQRLLRSREADESERKAAETKGAKRIVVCLDGTWNEPRNNTNVSHVARGVATVAEDGVPQVVYYHQGLGLGVGVVQFFTGGIFGRGIDEALVDCYRFLAQNYSEGDEIFLFGFSRGAYTALCLAGMLDAVGMVPKSQLGSAKGGDPVRDALHAYRRSCRSKTGKAVEATTDFRKRYQSVDVRVKFLGLWDTVRALGLSQFNFITGFIPGADLAIKCFDEWLLSYTDHAPSCVEQVSHAVAVDEKRKDFAPTLLAKHLNADSTAERVDELWFPGTHCNVGGYCLPFAHLGRLGCKDFGRLLSRHTCRWMLAQAQAQGLGLDESEEGYLDKQGLLPSQDDAALFGGKVKGKAKQIKAEMARSLDHTSYVVSGFHGGAWRSMHRETTVDAEVIELLKRDTPNYAAVCNPDLQRVEKVIQTKDPQNPEKNLAYKIYYEQKNRSCLANCTTWIPIFPCVSLCKWIATLPILFVIFLLSLPKKLMIEPY